VTRLLILSRKKDRGAIAQRPGKNRGIRMRIHNSVCSVLKGRFYSNWGKAKHIW